MNKEWNTFIHVWEKLTLIWKVQPGYQSKKVVTSNIRCQVFIYTDWMKNFIPISTFFDEPLWL